MSLTTWADFSPRQYVHSRRRTAVSESSSDSDQTHAWARAALSPESCPPLSTLHSARAQNAHRSSRGRVSTHVRGHTGLPSTFPIHTQQPHEPLYELVRAETRIGQTQIVSDAGGCDSSLLIVRGLSSLPNARIARLPGSAAPLLAPSPRSGEGGGCPCLSGRAPRGRPRPRLGRAMATGAAACPRPYGGGAASGCGWRARCGQGCAARCGTTCAQSRALWR